MNKSILIPKVKTIPLVNEKGKPTKKFTVGKPGNSASTSYSGYVFIGGVLPLPLFVKVKLV